MFKLNAKFDADSLLYWLSHSYATSTQYTCSLTGHLPPPLTSTVKSSLFMHACSTPLLWLPDYIDVVQTILVLLIVAGFFSGQTSYEQLYLKLAELLS